MLNFGMIRWKNLLSTGNVFTEMNLGCVGTTLVIGSNGAGKSSLLDAFSYVLYGKPFRKVNKGQLLNTINKKDLLVEIEINVGDVKFEIRRGMKPNVFEVRQDGVLLDQHGSTADLQEYLERHVLKMNHKSCMQVVVLGSASFVPFMELQAGHRREVLEDILDIKFISAMNALLKGRAEQTTRSLKDADYKREPLAEMVAMQAKFEQAREEDRQSQLDAIQSRVDDMTTKKARTAERAVELLESIKTLKSSLNEGVYEAYEKAKEKRDVVRYHSSQAVDRMHFFEKNGACPTCEQKISDDHKHQSLDDLKRELDELASEGVELSELMVRLKADLDENTKRHHEIQTLTGEVSIAKRIIAGLDEDIAKAEDEMKAVNSTDNKSEAPREDFKEKLTSLDQERASLMHEHEVESLISVLLKDSGVKALIVKQYIPVINGLINKYLAALDFFVNFTLDEEFNERILARHRDDFTYHSFSEGEKMRINLAILFTWRAIAKMRNSAATNVVIMDEIFDSSLDSSGADDFTKLLAKLTGDTHAVIISHRSDQISDKFDRIHRFEKIKNFSRMVTT